MPTTLHQTTCYNSKIMSLLITTVIMYIICSNIANKNDNYSQYIPRIYLHAKQKNMQERQYTKISIAKNSLKCPY